MKRDIIETLEAQVFNCPNNFSYKVILFDKETGDRYSFQFNRDTETLNPSQAALKAYHELASQWSPL